MVRHFRHTQNIKHKNEQKKFKYKFVTKNSTGGWGTVDYLEQFCAIPKVPMVLIKESTN